MAKEFDDDASTAADAAGTLHFARFVPLVGNKAVVLVAEYDPALEKQMADITKSLGPTLDKMFENLADPPTTPVASNVPAFLQWIRKHSLKPWVFYTGYPTLTVQDIRAQAH